MDPPTFFDKDIEYRTWGEDGAESLILIKPVSSAGRSDYFDSYKVGFPSSEMSLSGVSKQYVYVYNSGEKGSSVIEADNLEETGIREAIYASTNTEDGKFTLARVERTLPYIDADDVEHNYYNMMQNKTQKLLIN